MSYTLYVISYDANKFMANAGLGRGLGSLIPNKNQNNRVSADASGKSMPAVETGDKILKVKLDDIKVNPMQPRQEFSSTGLGELVDSIKEYGVIQPLIVTREGEGYELIAGERRLRAAREAGLEKVPVMVRDAGKQEKLEVALIENIQRENLNAVELGAAYKRLIDEFNLTQEEVAKRVGKSRPVVTNTLRMLNLPDKIKDALIEGRITEGHAKYLLGLDNIDKQYNLFNKIVRNSLSVDDTNQEAKRMGGTKKARIKINYEDKDKEFAFREFFGTKVEVKRKGRGGQVIIEFFSDEELREMIDKIK